MTLTSFKYLLFASSSPISTNSPLTSRITPPSPPHLPSFPNAPQPLLQAGIVALVGCPSLLHWKFVYTTKCGLWLGTANATIQAYNANLGEMLVHADPAYDHTFFHIVLKCINSLYPYELSMYLEGRGLLLPDPNKALEHSAASKLHVMSRLNGFQVYLNARGVDMRKAILSRLRG